MYSLRQLSRTCFKRPEYPWLYSGETTTNASALLMLAEKSACLMASPASFVGRGSFAISMRSVSTPTHLLSSPVTSRAACRLIRPTLAVPRITGMNKARLASIKCSSVKCGHCIVHRWTATIEPAQCSPPCLGRLLYGGTLELDDLARCSRGTHCLFAGLKPGGT